MIDPKEIEIDGKTFILSKFPAIKGREIVAKYPLSSMPKLGDYAVNEEIMLQLMSFVSIPIAGKPVRLNTRGLIENYITSWETLAKIEWAMLEYNCSFLQNGAISRFFDGIAQKLPQLIFKILKDYSGRSSPAEKQPSTN